MKILNIKDVEKHLESQNYPFTIECQEDNPKHTFEVEALEERWHTEPFMDDDDCMIHYGIIIDNAGIQSDALIDLNWRTIEF